MKLWRSFLCDFHRQPATFAALGESNSIILRAFSQDILYLCCSLKAWFLKLWVATPAPDDSDLP
jgi:hypothetical protein